MERNLQGGCCHLKVVAHLLLPPNLVLLHQSQLVATADRLVDSVPSGNSK
jgi:hypothetical protein